MNISSLHEHFEIRVFIKFQYVKIIFFGSSSDIFFFRYCQGGPGECIEPYRMNPSGFPNSVAPVCPRNKKVCQNCEPGTACGDDNGKTGRCDSDGICTYV